MRKQLDKKHMKGSLVHEKVHLEECNHISHENDKHKREQSNSELLICVGYNRYYK